MRCSCVQPSCVDPTPPQGLARIDASAKQLARAKARMARKAFSKRQLVRFGIPHLVIRLGCSKNRMLVRYALQLGSDLLRGAIERRSVQDGFRAALQVSTPSRFMSNVAVCPSPPLCVPTTRR